MGAETAGVVGLVRGAAEDGGVGAERHRDLDREMAQAAQPRHGDAAAGSDAEGAQGFPDGDPGAEQRCRGGRIQAGGKDVGEPVADDVFAGEATQGGRSVMPVDAPVGEGREGVAEVLLAGLAHRALAARIDDVADRDGVAGEKRVTAVPVSVTTPVNSCPGTSGRPASPSWAWTACRSVWQTPQ